MSDIIFYDYQEATYYKLEKNKIREFKEFTPLKNYLYIGLLNSKDIINATVEIPKNSEKNAIAELIEFQTYQDLVLDENILYKINYIKKTLQGENVDYDVFAVNSETIVKQFEPFVEKSRYIDYIASPAFIFEALYKQKILEPDDIHCFLYFGLNDSFIVVYKDAKCIFFKSLKFSIRELSEKFNEYYGKIFDFENFISILSTDELKQKEQKFIMSLNNLYNDIIVHLMDILIYVKRLNSIENFEIFFIDSDYGLEKDFYEMFTTITEFDVKRFNFNFPFLPHSNQLINLMFLSAIDYENSKNSEINFTIYEKPLPIYKKQSFSFLLLSAASIASIAIYPLYAYFLTTLINIESENLRVSDAQLNTKITSFSNIVQSYNTKEKNFEQVLTNTSQELKKLEHVINSVFNQKKSNPEKISILIDTIKQLNAHNINIKKCQIENKNLQTVIKLAIIANDEHYITNFLKNLSKDFVIAFDEISKIDKKYTSDIEVYIR
ncbi:MAG: hypothetical protein HXX81_00255 [Campylobacterales bacterium]|nr:hypothetical protein [Campylobacterales bacterium]